MLIVLVLLSAIAYGGYYLYEKGRSDAVVPDGNDSDKNGDKYADIKDFEDCLAGNFTILETYPRQCQLPNGKKFTEEVDMSDLIVVTSPRENEAVKSPLKITGEARGSWFFEASFPIKIYDENGAVLGTAVAEALTDWMTDSFVPFEATLNFDAPAAGDGFIIFENDNPSGLPENAKSMKLPITFPRNAEKRTVSLFYYDSKKDKDAKGGVNCSENGLTEFKRDITGSNFIIKDTIKLLLRAELTKEEKTPELTPLFPLSGVELTDVSLDNNDVLTLSFNDPKNQLSGGSCRVGILRMEIEKTALQFEEVESVRFIPTTLFQP